MKNYVTVVDYVSPAVTKVRYRSLMGRPRLISDLMCDGLGACIGQCPQDAIHIEKREAEAYDEIRVMEHMVAKGKNTVIAHLKHLKEHQETDLLHAGVKYLKDHEEGLGFSVGEVTSEVHGHTGCQHSEAVKTGNIETAYSVAGVKSELRQWPVQLHLVNPQAPYYRNADVLIAADCTAYTIANFHQQYLKGKSLAIACPKLDSNLDVYLNKITAMIDYSEINTITVMIMQVPCCGGLLRIVQQAVAVARRKVPVKKMVVSVEGQILQEEWL